MNEHKWQSRVLIIQAPSDSSNAYQEQIKEFRDSENELKERKIVLYEVINDMVRMTDYHGEKSDNSWQKAHKSMIAEFGGDDEFRITLIGLDGGIKLEKRTVLKMEELFGKIDSMPMRMNELKNQQRTTKNK